MYDVVMRSYGQYCALAKALDVVGDRWTLLIVRELLIRGASRYTDLRDGLPGIATNLLVDRLRELQQTGLVSREDAPPPVATALFRLTPRGEELETALYQLGRWGAPLLATAPKKDEFRTHWLALPVRHWLQDHTPERPPVKIAVRAGGQPVILETVDGSVQVRLDSVDGPDAAITGTPPLVAALLAGKLNLSQARAAGVKYEGDPETLRRLQPLAVGKLAVDERRKTPV
jgi:DNA-binding HxlR family transcriptional regulator